MHVCVYEVEVGWGGAEHSKHREQYMQRPLVEKSLAWSRNKTGCTETGTH